MSTADTTKTHYNEAKKLFTTPKGRGNFVALAERFKNKDAKEGDKGAFALSLLFPPTVNIDPLKKAANKAGKEKFGNDFDLFDPKKRKARKSPFLDPVEKGVEVLDENDEPVDLSGWTMIRFNTRKGRPVVRNGKGEVIDTDEYDTECYSGRWFRVSTRPGAYDQGGGSGVKFYLEAVQALKHDKAIGGGVQDNGEDFEAVDDEDGDDPMA